MSRGLSAASVISQFLNWWLGELRAVVSDLITFVAPNWRRAHTVYVTAERISFYHQDATSQPIIEFPRDTVAAQSMPSTPDALLPAIESNNRVRLVLDPELAYQRSLQLPLAALSHLESAIAIQLPKLLPLDTSRLVTDFEVRAVSSAKELIDIDLAALKRADVLPIGDGLRQWGMRVMGTQLGSASDDGPRFDFSHGGFRAHGFRLRGIDKILATMAALLVLSCILVAATEKYRNDRALDRAEAITHPRALVALRSREELLSHLEPLIALSQLESDPTAAALLFDISVRIPQNTWLTTLDLKENHLRIVGLSPNPAGIVKFLSGSSLLSSIELRSSMSVGIGTGLDRFEVGAELISGKP